MVKVLRASLSLIWVNGILISAWHVYMIRNPGEALTNAKHNLDVRISIPTIRSALPNRNANASFRPSCHCNSLANHAGEHLNADRFIGSLLVDSIN